MDDASLDDLERKRAHLYDELAATGDFRRGSISANYRRCGKPNCVCAQPDHPGHGPRYLWNRTVAGRGTKGRQLSAEEVDKVRAELANYHRFAQVSEQIVAVNEAICETRPPNTATTAPPAATGDEKRGLYEQIAAEVAAEVERLAAVAVDSLGPSGAGLAAVELAIRTAMSRLGASLLGQLLATDTGHRGPRIDCGAGHHAAFVGYRDRTSTPCWAVSWCAAPTTTAPRAGAGSSRATTSWASPAPRCHRDCASPRAPPRPAVAQAADLLADLAESG